uniref:Uncharacterized protein n=1 Tax=Eutreptiella gymnastica TaxID=73025 RepID=A0A7S4LBI6_9EUGL
MPVGSSDAPDATKDKHSEPTCFVAQRQLSTAPSCHPPPTNPRQHTAEAPLQGSGGTNTRCKDSPAPSGSTPSACRPRTMAAGSVAGVWLVGLCEWPTAGARGGVPPDTTALQILFGPLYHPRH